jgi:hypothetical protein
MASPLVPVSIYLLLSIPLYWNLLTFQKQDRKIGFTQRKLWIGKCECTLLMVANLLSYMCWAIAIEFAREECVQFSFPRLSP